MHGTVIWEKEKTGYDCSFPLLQVLYDSLGQKG